MIKDVLTYYASIMETYVAKRHPQQEGCVEVGFVGSSMELKPNKIRLSVISIERESIPYNGSSGHINNTAYAGGAVPLAMNVNVLIASVFEERKYADSLGLISDAIAFIQSSPTFMHKGILYTIEIVSMSLQELNNVWSCLGGQYHPSLVCKIRRFVFDSTYMSRAGRIGTRHELID
ncbi:MAG: DUF4255 domain-containing protein [Paludibacteraceae bacterium]|nr:DUF4255 domain-containing protein [Paludibacteraceae bacterium]